MAPRSLSLSLSLSLSELLQDIRFLKDVDWRWEYQCLCWCKRKQMLLLFDHDQTVGDADEAHISHPDVGDELTSEIQALWAEARLVAD